MPNYILVLQAELCRAIYTGYMFHGTELFENASCMKDIETVQVSLTYQVAAGECVEKDLVEIVTETHEEIYENLDAFSGSCRNHYLELVQLKRNLAQQKEMDRLFQLNKEMDKQHNTNSNSGKKSS